MAETIFLWIYGIFAGITIGGLLLFALIKLVGSLWGLIKDAVDDWRY